ncbi:MAG: hypothetical protein AAF773_05455 [Cyanobacteria bacterium P01_D01_bin.115]
MMTNSNQNGDSSDRLDRIEMVLERITERMERISTSVQDERIQRAEDYNELRNAITTTNQAVETTNRRIDAFITENRANWERYERHKAENDLRFNNLLADARADRDEMRRQREANQRDHDEFRAAIRSLLDRQSENEGGNG